jgi:UDP-glucose 4-epimerase
MNILVTGGAGYIGSHMVHYLVPRKHRVVILDNLSTGHELLIHPDALFINGDINNKSFVENLLRSYEIEAVIHFAAFIRVDESVSNPMKYYNNNTFGTLQLIEACHNIGVPRFIFSSTAAVYGNGSDDPITEKFPTNPLNPYGQSKLMSEKILADIANLGTIRYAILRYFNVAGAHNDSDIGQISNNSTHLIKVAAETAQGKRPEMFINGTDYSTSDGTCIRDYIHVQDLVGAHMCALHFLSSGGESGIYNLGYGHGSSVNEVINSMKKVSGRDFKVSEGPRRPGDGRQLVADSTKAKQVLQWKPQFDNLDLICNSALNWEISLGSGLEDKLI